MSTTFWLWVGFNVLVVALLVLDLGVMHRKTRVIPAREALLLSFGYFCMAMLFNAGVFYFLGEQKGYEFLTGYLIEWSLSIDNIFVFLLVFSFLRVPAEFQHRVLFWGIIGALAMRGLLIFVGAALIQSFHWVIFIFGGFLIFTAIKMLLTVDAKPDLENNRILKFARRRLRVTPDYHGQRFFVRRDGVLWATPLFLALIMVEFTDLVFAIDSIPAIFAITTDPFIVYTSNVFAILGLRALFFALAGIVHRFHYLKYGLSLVLLVVGAKMILNGVYGEKVLPTEIALLITGGLIFGSIGLSLIKTRGAPAPAGAEAETFITGWVPGSPEKPVKKTRPVGR